MATDAATGAGAAAAADVFQQADLVFLVQDLKELTTQSLTLIRYKIAQGRTV